MSLFVIIMGTVLTLGGLHMTAPDHWVPLMVVSKKLDYSKRRTLVNAAALGGLHAITSEAVAAIALIVGILLVKNFLNYLEIASVILLVLVGLYFVYTGYTEGEHTDNYTNMSTRSIIGISVFPDFALIPIMLASSPLSLISIVTVAVTFIAISSLSLTIMVFGAAKGFARAMEKVPPRYVDYIMGSVLFLTAVIITLLPI